MLKRLRSLPSPRRAGALLACAVTLLSAGALGAAAPAQAQSGGRVTAAVLPLDDPGRPGGAAGGGHEPTVYGEDAPYDTASIIKVDILATALLQAQDAGRALTAQERAYAEPMIRHSDNAAANALWRRIGRAPGLEAANKRLGLTATKGGPGAKWGLTQTTASDQIRLLRAVFDTSGSTSGGSGDGTGSALNAASRAYIRSLMNQVSADQAWGVSAAGSPSATALKNGWLQRSTSGLWDVNSVGRITVDGHRYLVAVLSDGNASMSEGVSLVQRTARAAVSSAASGH
ncbi:serine hydrolase [Streptomyces sp. NPDC056160]|uniref:serine hydrolase n=1 Tax=Streptomyces sp. NPDC056160 TaxID=3345731 RepID=UPI0035DEDB87